MRAAGRESGNGSGSVDGQRFKRRLIMESGMVVELLLSRKESEWMDEELERRPTRRKRQTFRLGDTVSIVSGPFVSFTGTIEGINQNNALLKVKVAIYGRNNPIKLNFSEVEKVSQ